MKFSSPRTIRRIEARTKERRLWRTISTINGRNRGIRGYSPHRKFWRAEYSDAYHDEIAGAFCAARGVGWRPLKFAGKQAAASIPITRKGFA